MPYMPLTYLVFKIILWSKYYHYAHFISEETAKLPEVPEPKMRSQIANQVNRSLSPWRVELGVLASSINTQLLDFLDFSKNPGVDC